MTTTDYFFRQPAAHRSRDQIRSPGLRKLGAASLCGGFLLLVGCGEGRSGPATVPVAGTLTVKGSPVEGAEVTFLHESFAAYGTTDSAGRFELVPGAVVGENKVAFSKWEGGPPGGAEAGFDNEMLRMLAEAGGPDAPKQAIPEEHSDVNTTTLTFNVPEEGTDQANFDL